ncbi:hypothetical protein [Delftia tsuruhatensis]|uniref:ArnR1-like winged helix-turn-helix domain-containing protein n=1 Tax=Delftia tsuruhatensis TaxID=180282 RepID=A0ABN4SGE4_9BURK|nr:hypothetical protein [Delftia tsuruhatensis]AOV01702.1 hypothetical protein BI380_10215 [Delftia tsuruhatensis]AOV02408.1 hypothetical protein BI380_14205 [Delftia tsuruhatensis]
MSPYEIHVLLDIHALAGMQHSQYSSAPIYLETLWSFQRHGLIDKVDSPVLTERGKAYVYLLESLPLPVAHWSIPGPWNPQIPPCTFKVGKGEE